MKEYIKKDLSCEKAYAALDAMLDPSTDDKDIHEFLTYKKPTDVTPDELLGFVKAMRERAEPLKKRAGILVDTCGTGGDCTGTINVSTGAAIIAASAGVSIAKHGNYAATSNSGSANVLEALGYNIHASPEEMIKNTGFGFLFAPNFYTAMSRVASIRRDLGKKTIFNLLGPLCNPANADAQLIGVYDESFCEKFCYVLKELGVKRALVVHGSGLDEISNLDETVVYELNNGDVKNYTIKPEDFELKRYELEDISGSSPEENAEHFRAVLKGKKGARRDSFVLNAAGAIYLGSGAPTLKEGIKEAEEAIDSGEASMKLHDIIECSNRF
ncbi:anthranilate phosphoribosyltransferase [Nanoarchaeota archaeon]